MCYRGCDGSVVITNISLSHSGALGSHHGSAVDHAIASHNHHVYCLWILMASDSWKEEKDFHAILPPLESSGMDDDHEAIMLTFPRNSLNTTCLRVCPSQFLILHCNIVACSIMAGGGSLGDGS